MDRRRRFVGDPGRFLLAMHATKRNFLKKLEKTFDTGCRLVIGYSCKEEMARKERGGKMRYFAVLDGTGLYVVAERFVNLQSSNILELKGYESWPGVYQRTLDHLNAGHSLKLTHEYKDFQKVFHLFDDRPNVNRGD